MRPLLQLQEVTVNFFILYHPFSDMWNGLIAMYSSLIKPNMDLD